MLDILVPEADVPVEHVPGAVEMPARRAKPRAASGGALFTPRSPIVLPDPATIPAWSTPALAEIHRDSNNVLARWIAFIVAREQARINRAAGLPREQWANDPLIRDRKFQTS
jgi:hypothetical protein